MRLVALFFAFILAAVSALAGRHIILVDSPNTTAVLSPNNVTAISGDVVIFCFIEGNHSVAQSTFYAACKVAHDSDPRINGFISGSRPINNGTAITELEYNIYPRNENITTCACSLGFGHLILTSSSKSWFYDASPHTCGWDNTTVGKINLRENSSETLAGFRRNAARLYGPEFLETSTTGTNKRTSATSIRTSSSDMRAAYHTGATQFAFSISLVVAALSVTFF